jgi:hypothetical protein
VLVGQFIDWASADMTHYTAKQLTSSVDTFTRHELVKIVVASG